MKEGHEAINPLHPSMMDKMDPVFIKIYNEHVANMPNRPIDLPVLRQNYSKIYSYGTAPAPVINDITEITFPSFDNVMVKLRIYKPDAYSDSLLPVHLDFHGGGWGLGDLDTESHILKHYVSLAKVAVVDVEYRLVPENPFPTGLKDCFEATKFIYNNATKFGFNKDSISVGGVSAGGNISLAVDHLCRDIGLKLKLVCAGTPQVSDIKDIDDPSESKYPSMKECEFAPTLNWARLKWFDTLKWSSFQEEDLEQIFKEVGWLKSILDAPDFKDLTKTVIYTAGCDPMRDEGETYAKKLIDNGVEVVFKRFPGVPHPFMHMDKDLWQAKQFIELTATELALAHETLKLR